VLRFLCEQGFSNSTERLVHDSSIILQYIPNDDLESAVYVTLAARNQSRLPWDKSQTISQILEARAVFQQQPDAWKGGKSLVSKLAKLQQTK